MSAYKPGVMCWINGRCGDKSLIGTIVTLIRFEGKVFVDFDLTYWRVESRDPLPVRKWSNSRHRVDGISHHTNFLMAEFALTPINGDDSALDTTSEVKNEDTALL